MRTAQANALTAGIGAAFAAIGVQSPTTMPKSPRNGEPFAYEYHVASLLARLAEARKRKAVSEAVKAGVMFDPDKTPRPVGTDALVYAGDVVEISVSVTTPTTKVDMEAFLADISKKHKVPADKLAALLVQHTHKNRAPHQFKSTIVTTCVSRKAERSGG